MIYSISNIFDSESILIYLIHFRTTEYYKKYDNAVSHKTCKTFLYGQLKKDKKTSLRKR